MGFFLRIWRRLTGRRPAAVGDFDIWTGAIRPDQRETLLATVAGAKDVWWVTAYADVPSVRDLAKRLENSSARVRLLVGQAAEHQRSWDAVAEAAQLASPSLECRGHPQCVSRIHAKFIVVTRDDAITTVILGSSNLTEAGFGRNREASVCFTACASDPAVKSLLGSFEQWFQGSLDASEFANAVQRPQTDEAAWEGDAWLSPTRAVTLAVTRSDEDGDVHARRDAHDAVASTSLPGIRDAHSNSWREQATAPAPEITASATTDSNEDSQEFGEPESAPGSRLSLSARLRARVTEPTSESGTDDEVGAEKAESSLLPREFQEEAIKRIISRERSTRSGSTVLRDLLVLPTGAGKTVVAANAIKQMLDEGRRVLWTTHRPELLQQAYTAFEQVGVPGSKMSMWTGRAKDDSGQVVFASTLACQVHRPRGPFHVTVIDEAHHAVTPSYTELLRNLRRGALRYTLLLTATPVRADGRGLDEGKHFDSVVYRKDFIDLAPQHLAVPQFQWREWPKEPKDERPARIVNGDFAADTLDELAKDRYRNDIICNEVLTRGRKTLIFAVNQDHAKRITKILTKSSVEARCVLAGTESGQRKEIIDWFRKTRSGVLVNCFVYLEGMDVPDLERLIIARPTFSKARYMQMVGRGARKGNSGEKTTFEVVDILDHFAEGAATPVTRPWMVLFPGEWARWSQGHVWPYEDQRRELHRRLQERLSLRSRTRGPSQRGANAEV